MHGRFYERRALRVEFEDRVTVAPQTAGFVFLGFGRRAGRGLGGGDG
ncbi:MAG: hypothetical protein ABSD85_04410 [Acidimicrobiales bacterium]